VHLSVSFRHTAERYFSIIGCVSATIRLRPPRVRQILQSHLARESVLLRSRECIGAGSRVILVYRSPAFLEKKITTRSTLTVHNNEHVSSQPELCSCIARSAAPCSSIVNQNATVVANCLFESLLRQLPTQWPKQGCDEHCDQNQPTNNGGPPFPPRDSVIAVWIYAGL